MSAHAPTVDLSDATVPQGNIWRKLPVALAAVGVVGLGGAFATAGEGNQFWFSYLTALMFWLSFGLGGLFFVLIHHGTRAGWSSVVRRIAENFMITLPLLGLLILPIVFGGMDALYHHWVHAPADDLIVAGKSSYLNTGAFTVRILIYIGVWVAMSVGFYAWSLKQDRTGDPKLAHRMRRLAPVGFVLFGLSITFVAIDLMMSLDPHWYSTIYGVYYFGGTFMTIAAAMILASMALQRAGVVKSAITNEHYHDLGKLGFAFMVFWAYIAFSQFMLMWYANIPEETVWYHHRATGGWEYVSMILFALHFVIPFFFLMSRHIKRRRMTLAAGAVLLLVSHYIDMFWLIQPTMTQHSGSTFAIHIADVLALIGIGGLVLAVFAWRTNAASVVPLKDPRLSESLHFENF